MGLRSFTSERKTGKKSVHLDGHSWIKQQFFLPISVTRTILLGFGSATQKSAWILDRSKVRNLRVLFLGIVSAVAVAVPGSLIASAAGTVPDPGPTPAISISSTLNTAAPDGAAVKKFIVSFRNTGTDPVSYLGRRSSGDSDLLLRWGGLEFCNVLTCDDQIIIDINGETYSRPYKVDQFSMGYIVELDRTDLDGPEAQVGDVVTIKLASGAFEMPDPNTGWEPYFRFDWIRPDGTNFSLEGPEEATVLALPASPDTPQAPTAAAGQEQATVTITPNSGGETVSAYRITSSPDGQTCDITPPETSCDVTGLQGGTSYTFTAVALNAGFPSSASSASNSVTPTAAPAGSSSSNGSSDTNRSSNSQAGIFLTVHGEAGSILSKTNVRYGSYAIQSNSPYLLSLREGSTMASQRVLASGRANSGGHLDRTTALPALPVGTYTVVLSAYDASGNPLILGNILTVNAAGKITSVTPESRQPSVR